MIKLSRLNGQAFFLNSDLIRTVESTPDTVITLTTGEKILVKEPVESVLQETLNYRKRIVQEPPRWT